MVKSKRGPSKSFSPGSSKGSSKRTSSPASVSGATPYVRSVGPTTRRSGPARVPANRSAVLGAKAASTTSGISGPIGSSSSSISALQSSLESRLRAKTVSLGSTLYAMTWKVRVTPSGRQICALRASVPRTSDSGFILEPCAKGSNTFYRISGWVTPTVRDWKDTPGMKTTGLDGRVRLDQLPRQAAQVTGWPTPTVKQGDYSYSHENHDTKSLKLAGAAKLAGWGTPTAGQARGTVEQVLARKQKLKDSGTSIGVSVTALNHQVQLTVTGEMPFSFPAATENLGQLNPSLPRWLMGLPILWDTCAPKG